MIGVRYSYLVALIICASSLSVYAEASDKDKALVHAAVEECLKEHSIEKDQVATLREKSPDVYYCAVSCVLKKTENFDKDGLADIEKIKENIKKHVKNEVKLSVVMDALDKCSKTNNEKVSDGDKGCERAKLFLECMEDATKHKINHILH